MQNDLFWTIIAFFLTILVLSYILGDNPLFKMVSYLFVGVSAGYVATLILSQVLFPRLIVPLLFAPLGEKLLSAAPAVLSVLLLFKLSPRLTTLGNVSMAFLVGSGAAVIIGGAVTGTLFGQIDAAITPFDTTIATSPANLGLQLLGGFVMLVGTVTTLAYFHFSAKPKPGQPVSRPKFVQFLSKIGQVFIAITLGAIYAGVLAASVTALIERLDFLRLALQSFLP